MQQPDTEVTLYMAWLKQYSKLYKAMYHKYTNVSQSKTANINKITFDDLLSHKSSMNLAEVFAFLSDF